MAGLDSVVVLFSGEEGDENDRKESIPLSKYAWVGIVSFLLLLRTIKGS